MRAWNRSEIAELNATNNALVRSYVLLFSLSLALSTSCVQFKTEVYRDANVIAFSKHAPLYPLNVHGGDTIYLSVAGKTYKDIRGSEPYYIELPHIHSILFVTEGIVFHIVNLTTKTHIAIPGRGSDFGRYLGHKAPMGRRFGDDVTV